MDEKVLDIIKKAAIMFDMDKVILFGTRAKGNYTSKSDYDLLAFGSNYYAFYNYMTDDVDSMCVFDVSNGNKASPDFLNEVMSYGVIVYEKVQ